MTYSKNEFISELLTNIKIKDIMAVPVITIYNYEPVSKALTIFTDKGIYYLPVINKEDQIVGMLTSKYIYKTQSPRKILSTDMAYDPDMIIDGDSFYDKNVIDNYKLENIMHPNPITLTEDDTVANAILLMSKHKLGCIPIVKIRRKVCGILTTHEIIRFMAQILKES